MSLQLLLALALASASSSNGAVIARVEAPPSRLKPLHFSAIGRVEAQPDGSVLRQWPGTYFETSVAADTLFFRVGAGDVSLRISVDGGSPISLVKPAPGFYRLSGIGTGTHGLRVDVASESQSGPTSFGGFFAPVTIGSGALPQRRRAIEFIGDSYTVGYGNRSPSRQCTDDQVWTSTDTSRGIARLTSKRFDADYEVNAISGRGIVRNYNGFAADTLPEVYPYTLFNKAHVDRRARWHPQVLIIGLGTNDFSTPLHEGEKWKSPDELRKDFEATYVHFVQQLRRSNPRAYMILWATDMTGSKVESEVSSVVRRLREAGDARVGFVPVKGLAFSACNSHPSLSDDQKIADDLATHIDAHPDIWKAR